MTAATGQYCHISTHDRAHRGSMLCSVCYGGLCYVKNAHWQPIGVWITSESFTMLEYRSGLR